MKATYVITFTMIAALNLLWAVDGFFSHLEKDDKMSPYHISLYLAIFQLWNLNRFKNPFSINRIEMMNLSRTRACFIYKCVYIQDFKVLYPFMVPLRQPYNY